MNLLEFIPEEDRGNYLIADTKLCKYCNEEKSLSDFPIRKDNYGGYDHRCQSCLKKRVAKVELLRKTAPPKPDRCEKCGVKPSPIDSKQRGHRYQGLCLDHDPITDEYRGYLCHLCNRCIGGLGDTIEGIQEALDYLIMAKKRNEKEIE